MIKTLLALWSSSKVGVYEAAGAALIIGGVATFAGKGGALIAGGVAALAKSLEHDLTRRNKPASR